MRCVQDLRQPNEWKFDHEDEHQNQQNEDDTQAEEHAERLQMVTTDKIVFVMHDHQSILGRA